MKGLIAAVPMLCVGAACYQYQPAPLSAVQPGQAVRVNLTLDGGAALASAIGPGATALDGRVVRRDDREITLALTQIMRAADQPEEFLQNEPLTLPLTGGATFSVRSLDKGRTVLAAGSIVALIVAGKAFIDQPGIFTTKGTVSQGTK
jgi:hypothetical protein